MPKTPSKLKLGPTSAPLTMHEVKGSDNQVTAVGAVGTFYMRAMSLEPHPMVRGKLPVSAKRVHMCYMHLGVCITPTS